MPQSPRPTIQSTASDGSGFTTFHHPNLVTGLILPDTFFKSQKAEMEAQEVRTRGKLFSNWVGTQYSAVQGTMDRSPRRPSHTLLKWVARNCVLDADIISAIIQAMQRFAKVCHYPKKQIGYRVVHKRAIDPEFKPDPEEQDRIQARCVQMEKLIRSTTPGIQQSLASCIAAFTDDGLSIDRKVMIKINDRRGRPKSYHWLPGETVRPLVDYLKPWMALYGQEDPKFLNNPLLTATRLSFQLYKDGTKDMNNKHIDLTDAQFVQVLDDQITAIWKDNEIAVDIVRPYNEIDEVMYGYSPVEASLKASVLWMQAWDYQSQLFSVTYPESLLVLKGDYSERGLDSFREQILAAYGNTQRLPIIAGGSIENGLEAQLIELRKTPQDMLFDTLLKFMISLKCAFYRVHPSLINFSSDAGPTENALPQERNYIIQEAYEEGIRARMEHLADWFTQELIEPWYDDLIMVWEGFDLMSEDGRRQMLLDMGERGIATTDEIRASLDMAALPKGVPGENYGEYPPSPIAIQIVGTINANKMQEQAQSAQANPPGMSQPAGAGGGDFGQGQGLPQEGEQPQAQGAAPPPGPPQPPAPPAAGAMPPPGGQGQ